MSLKVITIVVLASMTLFSCGWKATQDDINKLEEQRSATLKAEETLVKKNQELEKTKREVEVEKNKRAGDYARSSLLLISGQEAERSFRCGFRRQMRLF